MVGEYFKLMDSKIKGSTADSFITSLSNNDAFVKS
jgi:hypothetical protein